MTHRILRPSSRIVQVGASDTILMAANPHRRAWRVSNPDPGSRIFLGVNVPAIVGQGVILSPNWQTLDCEVEHFGELAAAELHAIAQLLGAPQVGQGSLSAAATGLSGATTGVKQSITVPAGQSGTLTLATISNFTGAPTVALQLVRSATTITLLTTTAQQDALENLTLQAGDVVQWNVTTAVAASAFDATLSATLFPSTGAAPASVGVGVWELEG